MDVVIFFIIVVDMGYFFIGICIGNIFGRACVMDNQFPGASFGNGRNVMFRHKIFVFPHSMGICFLDNIIVFSDIKQIFLRNPASDSTLFLLSFFEWFIFSHTAFR